MYISCSFLLFIDFHEAVFLHMTDMSTMQEPTIIIIIFKVN